MKDDISPSQNEIKALRERLAISQASFAEQLGISQPMLSRIESGEAPLTDALLLRVAIHFREPDLLRNRCRRCPINKARREFYPTLSSSNQQLLVRQLREGVTSVLKRMSRLGDELPPPSMPQFHLHLMELDEYAAQLHNLVEGFRLLLHRDL